MEPLVTIETARLLLRRPAASDAESIFSRYASDPEVTRYVGFPRHTSIGDTRAFLEYSDCEWERWPAGPYLILARDTGELLGGTGYTFETSDRALTGYVLARDAWGRGYATEALRAVVEAAPRFGVKELRALCHAGHRPSWHVLEKCGFKREQVVRPHEFPNLPPPSHADVFTYTLTIVT